MAESLPKYMFLSEDSEHMHDKREVNKNMEKVITKRIHSTLPIPDSTYNNSLHNLIYSNQSSLMLMASQDHTLVLHLPQIEVLLKTGKMPKQLPKIGFSGELFLSPNEELLVICTHTLIQIVQMASIPAITSPPIANIHNSQHFLWVTNTHLLLWNFLGDAYLMTINPLKSNQFSIKKLEDVKQCTGASIIGDTLLIAQKIEVWAYNLGEIIPKAKKNLSYQDHDNIVYEYSFIVQMFRVNIHDSPEKLNTRITLPLNEDDIIGLVLVYYDDDEQMPDQRFLTFFKGHLMESELQFHGNQIFYSAKNCRQLYYEDDIKIPFGVKVLNSGYFICLSFERSEVTYIIDPFEKVQVINIYDVSGKLELKDPDGNFFRGVAVMRNMLPFERELPKEGSTPLLETIVNKFQGQFMSLYFANQETHLTIPFPLSIIAISDKTFFRRYAISSLDSIDKDLDSEIIAQMESMKKSPHIIASKERKEIASQPLNKKQAQSPKKIPQQKKQMPKQEKKEDKSHDNQIVKQKEKIQQKTEIKVDKKESNNLFSNIPGNNEPKSIFGTYNSSLPFPSLPATTTTNLMPSTKASGLFGMSTDDKEKKNLFSSDSSARNNVADMFEKVTKPLNSKPGETTIPAYVYDKANPFVEKCDLFEPISNLGVKDPKTFTFPFVNKEALAKDVLKPENKSSFTMNQGVFVQNKLVQPIITKTTQEKVPLPIQIPEQKKVNNPIQTPSNTMSGLFKPTIKSSEPVNLFNSPKQVTAIKPCLTPQAPDNSKDPAKIQKLRQQAFKTSSFNLQKMNVALKNQNKVNMTLVRQFCQKELGSLKKSQQLYLGAPLNIIMRKAESIKSMHLRYQWIFQSCLNSSIEEKVEQQLKMVEEQLNRALFFSNVINVQKKRRNMTKKENVPSGPAIEGQLRYLKSVYDERRGDLSVELEQMVEEIRIINQKRMKMVEESRVSQKSSRRMFNFQEFTGRQSHKSVIADPVINRSTLKKESTKVSSEIITFSYKDIDHTPLFSLEPFQVKPARPKPPPSDPPIAELAVPNKQPQKFQMVQSVADLRGSIGPAKSKEKVSIPAVNTKMIELNEKVAISEEMDKSDLEDPDFPLPTAVRQISKIDISSQQNKPKLPFGAAVSKPTDKNEIKPSETISENTKNTNKTIGVDLKKPEQRLSENKGSLFGKLQAPAGSLFAKKQEKGEPKVDDQKDKKDGKKQILKQASMTSSTSLFGLQSNPFGAKSQAKVDKEQSTVNKKVQKSENDASKPKQITTPPTATVQKQPQNEKGIKQTEVIKPAVNPTAPTEQKQAKVLISPFGQLGQGKNSLFSSLNNKQVKTEKTDNNVTIQAQVPANKEDKVSQAEITIHKKETESQAKGGAIGNLDKKDKGQTSTDPIMSSLFGNSSKSALNDADNQKIFNNKAVPPSTTEEKKEDKPKPSQPFFSSQQSQNTSTNNVISQPLVPATQAKAAFGGANKFLSGQTSQTSQGSGFNPNVMTFGGATGGQKTFGNVGEASSNFLQGNTGNSSFQGSMQGGQMFGNNNQGSGGNNLFKPPMQQQQGPMFGSPQTGQQNNMFQQNQGNIYAQQQQQGGMQNQAGNNIYQSGGVGGNFQGGGGGSNFLQGASGDNKVVPPTNVIPSMMAMRK